MRHKGPILIEYRNFLARNHSASTIEKYMYIVSELLEFCSEESIKLKKLKVSHLYLFFRRRSFSINYLKIQITVANNFLSWCGSMGIIDMANIKRIEQLEKAARKQITLSDFQFKEFSSFMDKAELKLKVLLKILYFTGIRVHEVVNLRIDDISFTDSVITIKGNEKEVIKSVPIFEELETDLKLYIKSIARKENDSHAFLFSKRNGGRLSRCHVYNLVSKFLRIFNGTEFGPRIIRNTRGFHLSRSHENIIGISELLNVDVGQALTYKYTDIVNYTRLQEIYRAAHPKA